MEAQYTLTADDVWRFQQYFRSRKSRINFVLSWAADVFILLISAILAALLVFSVYQNRALFGTGLFGLRLFVILHQRLVLGFVACIVADIYIFWVSKVLTLRSIATKMKLPSERLSFLRPDGLHTLIGGKESFLLWSRVVDIVDDGRSFYFFLNKQKAIIIPRRAFSAARYASEFFKTAEGYWRGTPSGVVLSTGAAWPPLPGSGHPQSGSTARTMVKIVRLPEGEAPEYVRGAWVGLILPVIESRGGPVRRDRTAGVLSRAELGVRLGYAVDKQEAISILAKTHPEAAEWWGQNLKSLNVGSPFLFGIDECEIVNAEKSTIGL